MSDLPSAPFWMVHGLGQRGPAVRHPSAGSAQGEAKRLARENPGIVFVVLESIGAVVKDDMKTIMFRAPASTAASVDEDIPF